MDQRDKIREKEMEKEIRNFKSLDEIIEDYSGIILSKWQEEAIKKLKNKNGILSAPTGAGKTEVCKKWADIDNPKQKIIFTAPIKALSNERYAELLEAGYNVGINTGDFKENTDARIICCTQEIYTAKYANIPNQNVIIDEFHYIANNQNRTRAYIDGIVNTNKSSNILVLSATFGNIDELQKYLSRIGKKDFEVYETDERQTELVLENEYLDYDEIENALVFCFHRNGIDSICYEIANERNFLEEDAIEKINEMAKALDIKIHSDSIYKGVGYYHGNMLPKEKLLMEMLYKNRLIDTIVGTDALSLGVNLPAQNVVFAQLSKFYDGPISQSEFLQMAGRAGRKGYYNTGYVYCLNDNSYESYDYQDYMDELYRDYITADGIEDMSIYLDIDMKNILEAISRTESGYYNLSSLIEEKRYIIYKDEKYEEEYFNNNIKENLNEEELEEIRYIDIYNLREDNQKLQEELNYVKNNSMNIQYEDKDRNKRLIQNLVDQIKILSYMTYSKKDLSSYYNTWIQEEYIESYEKNKNSIELKKIEENFIDLLKDIYFSEFDISQNMLYAYKIINNEFDIVNEIENMEEYKDLLQLKRYINHMPKEIRNKISNKSKIDKVLNEVDPTTTNYVKYRNEIKEIAANKIEK